METYDYLRNLGISKKVNNPDELGLSLVEEFKQERPKRHEIGKKIEDYGQSILDNVIMELKEYTNYQG